MDEQQVTMIRACLLLCARRLRDYESGHRMKLNGTLSLVERQEAERDAMTDGSLANMAEGFFRTSKQAEPVAPEPSSV